VINLVYRRYMIQTNVNNGVFFCQVVEKFTLKVNSEVFMIQSRNLAYNIHYPL